jgi:transposase
VDRALIDGEAVVLRDDGRSDFGVLMTKRGRAQASLVVCRRLVTIPGVGQLIALAFVAAIDDPSPIRRSRNIGAYLGLVPRRYQSGKVDYVGGISKCGDRRMRTLLYEAANVMLTRYKGQLQTQGLGQYRRQF